MATTPVNNSKLLNPLIAPKAKDATEASKTTGSAAAALAGAAAPPAASGRSVTAGGPADVRISDTGKDRAAAMQKALDIARDTPDVREDRVASLKAQIEAGTYQVDSGKIADGMLREAIKDHFAETEGR